MNLGQPMKPDEKSLRILVVDDHPVLREGLVLFLNQDPGFQVLGSADSGRTGLVLLKKLNPDLVILDLFMPEIHGMQAIHLFKDACPQVKILIFSASCEEKNVYQALRAGAQGYVVKGAPIEELRQAIHYIQGGGYFVSPRFSQSLVKCYLSNLPEDSSEALPFESLSGREQQVLRLMVEGKDTEAIAELLDISVNTVAKHRMAVMKKLNLKNVVEMTRFAIRHGIIDA